MHTEKELREYLSRYIEALQVRSEAHQTSKDVVAQDLWYRTTLRQKLKDRKQKEGTAYLDKSDLVTLMQWKLARGKWRPRLEQYMRDHSEKEIRSATEAAFKGLDEDKGQAQSAALPIESLKALTELKGIGPATASAILAAYAPSRVPFLSDEAAIGVGNLGPKPDYTEAYLKRYVARIHERAEEEGWSDIDELERACYAAGIIQKYGAQREGQKAREHGKLKDAQEFIERAKTSTTADEKKAKSSSDAKPSGGKKAERSARSSGQKRKADGKAEHKAGQRKSARLSSK